jgi:hypothetical protein
MIVAPASIAAYRAGRTVLMTAALWGCGLSVSGEASVGFMRDGSSPASSGGAGSSGGFGSSSGAASGGYVDSGLLLNLDGSTSRDSSVHASDTGADSRAPLDAGPSDAPDDGATCAKLTTCCALLAAYGTAASTVTSCQAAAATKNQSTCQSVLSPFESFAVCP